MNSQPARCDDTTHGIMLIQGSNQNRSNRRAPNSMFFFCFGEISGINMRRKGKSGKSGAWNLHYGRWFYHPWPFCSYFDNTGSSFCHFDIRTANHSYLPLRFCCLPISFFRQALTVKRVESVRSFSRAVLRTFAVSCLFSNTILVQPSR